MPINKLYIRAVLLLLTILGNVYQSTNIYAQAVSTPVFDISEEDFSDHKSVQLNGKWAFYWKQLIPATTSEFPQPDTLLPFTTNWNDVKRFGSFGYATYAATIVLPDRRPSMALTIPDFYCSYELFINGTSFAKNGEVGTSKETYIPKWLTQTIPLGQLEADTLQLVLYISNFDHVKGGAYSPITLGSNEQLLKEQFLDYGYSFILTGALLMGGMFFLGLYLFGRHDNSILYFSLFCIIYSYRILGFGSYPLHFLIPGAPWILTLKLEYITLFLSGFIFGEYTLSLYPQEVPKRLIRVFSTISLTFVVISLFLSPQLFTQLVEPYFIMLLFYLLVAFWVYTVAVLNHRPGATYSLFSSGVVFVVFGYQILVYFGFLPPSLLLNFFGYIFFFFFQSLVLSYRFTNSLQTALVRAEESSLAKSQFLSTMSHEIRTPLNAVIGLSGLLYESRLSEKQREFANTIKQSGESLLGLINNILDFSKIESGKLEVESTEFSLVETVELVIDVVSSSAQKHLVELIYTIDDDVPDYVLGDSTRLQQVLTNLVANAFKFTHQGEIVVSISTQKKIGDKITLQIDVKDTGIGIPKNKMDRLFQSFSQVDASSTRRYGGTGLGLIISKRLIEAMGGTIWVTSEEDMGSTFSFTLNLGISQRTKHSTDIANLQGKTCFILDDNITNLKIMKEQLGSVGVEVSMFSTPESLLNTMNSLGDFDFGILDLQMPGINGLQIGQQIRVYWNNEQLPLVMFSSVHELDALRDKKMFDLYLKKPIQQSRFLNNIDLLFEDNHRHKMDMQLELPSSKLFRTDFSILVAEDNLINQKVILRILEQLGIHIDIANDGREVLQMTEEQHYDLIFMDMEMPIMDGLETTRRLRDRTQDNNELPIIVAMTANAMQEDKERCFAAGMNDFISKPITVESTKSILKKWLQDP